MVKLVAFNCDACEAKFVKARIDLPMALSDCSKM
jgi:hypothetical protein